MTEKYKEEVYRQAIIKWKENNPDKKYLDISCQEKIDIEGIGLVNIGRRISELRYVYKKQQLGQVNSRNKHLTKEQIAWYTEQGMIWDYEAWQEEVYRKAILKWKEQHPEKRYLDIKKKEQIELEGIGLINLGVLISIRRGIYNAMQQGKKYYTCKTLTREQISWDTEQGMIWDYEAWQEEIYRKAILKWKENNPDKKYLDINCREKIDIEGVGLINIGAKISVIRQIYQKQQEAKRVGTNKPLTREQIIWYTEQGMIWDYEAWQEEIYRQAITKWKENNPDKKYLDINCQQKIDVEGVGLINIGTRISVIRRIYQKQQEAKRVGTNKPLTREQIIWYTEQGMIWDYEAWQEKVYQEAAIEWKKLHPEKAYLDINYNDSIKLAGIGTINIGTKINRLREKYKLQKKENNPTSAKLLTDEQIAWWNSQGMIWDYKKYQEGRKGKIYQKK